MIDGEKFYVEGKCYQSMIDGNKKYREKNRDKINKKNREYKKKIQEKEDKEEIEKKEKYMNLEKNKNKNN